MQRLILDREDHRSALLFTTYCSRQVWQRSSKMICYSAKSDLQGGTVDSQLHWRNVFRPFEEQEVLVQVISHFSFCVSILTAASPSPMKRRILVDSKS